MPHTCTQSKANLLCLDCTTKICRQCVEEHSSHTIVAANSFKKIARDCIKQTRKTAIDQIHKHSQLISSIIESLSSSKMKVPNSLFQSIRGATIQGKAKRALIIKNISNYKNEKDFVKIQSEFTEIIEQFASYKSKCSSLSILSSNAKTYLNLNLISPDQNVVDMEAKHGKYFTDSNVPHLPKGTKREWVDALKCSDDSIYTGYVFKGTPTKDGWGVSIMKDGSKYEGYWVQNRKHKGRMILKEPRIYEGSYSNDKPCSIGKVIFFNGDTYEGECNEEYLIHGSGKYIWNSGVWKGDTYDGQWENNKKKGVGKYIYANKDVYEGEWNENVQNGKGKYTYSDGSTYEGDWKNTLREGKGKCVHANGHIYDGDWHENCMHGHGKYEWYTNGVLTRMYEGEWKNNVLEGNGIFKESDGSRYEGVFANFKMNGKGKCISSNGATYEGEYKNHKMHGKGLLTDKDGIIYEGEWKEGEKVGQFTIRDLNSKIKIVTY